MTIQNDIDILESKIKALQLESQGLKYRQSQCKHVFTKMNYTPELVREPYVNGYTTHGIHMEPNVYYSDKERPRWSRTCTECGIIQYTYQNPNPLPPKVDWK